MSLLVRLLKGTGHTRKHYPSRVIILLYALDRLLSYAIMCNRAMFSPSPLTLLTQPVCVRYNYCGLDHTGNCMIALLLAKKLGD